MTRVNNLKKELQINIENVVSCASNCDGCILTNDERKSRVIPSNDLLYHISNYINEYLLYRQSSLNDVDEVAINSVQGDHLLLSYEQLNSLYDNLFLKINHNKKYITLTSSGVLNHNQFINKVDFIHTKSVENNLPNMLAVIFDPTKENLTSFVDKYYKNINYVKEKFGGVDLEMNISPDIVNSYSPEQIVDFMINNHFSLLNINYVITQQNAEHFYTNSEKIGNWLNHLYNLYFKNYNNMNQHFELSFIPHVGRFVENKLNSDEDNKLLLNYSLHNQLYIDKLGNVFFMLTGFGDVGLTARNGFYKIDNVINGFNSKIFEEKIQFQLSKMNTIYFKHISCRNCEYLSACMQSNIINQLNAYKNIKLSNNECPVYMKQLFKTAELNNHHENLANSYYQFKPIYTQKGLIRDDLNKIVSS